MSTIASKLAAALKKGGIESDEQKDVGLFLSTGMPNVDYAISGSYTGGGLKSARIAEIAGPESSGKTLLAQHVMKEAQLAGGAAAFHDHEETFMPHLFESFGGDISEGIFTLKTPDTFEQSLDQSIDWMTNIRESGVIPFQAPLVVVFDSLHSMVPDSDMAREKGKGKNMRERLSLPQATSAEFPAFTKFVKKNNVLAIFLNQLRTKPGVSYGDPRYTPGGDTLNFYASVRIFLSRRMDRDKKTKETTGQTITAETVKNKTYPPFKRAEWVFKFKDNVGYIDTIDSMVGHLLDIEALETAGAYIVWDGKKVYRSQLVDALNQSPEAAMKRLLEIAEKTR